MMRDAPPMELGDNDGVLYRGRELVHYRYPRGVVVGSGEESAACALHQVVFAWRSVHDLHCIFE